MGQFDKCYGAVEEGVTNSVCLDGMLHKGDDICANNLCAGKAQNVFLAEETLCAEAWRFKEMCWWEGVADEARMMKGSERARQGEVPPAHTPTAGQAAASRQRPRQR